MGDILLLNEFFPIVNTCLSCEDIARQSCAIVRRWRLFGDFLGPAFPASRVQHISHLHTKFALGPHHVWKYDRYPICGRRLDVYHTSTHGVALVMVALCNRADHYIFILFLLSFFLLLFFPRLISAVGDWMSTILRHMVWS